MSEQRFPGLKPGDTVLVETKIDGGWRYERRAILTHTVDRVMKTQFVTTSGKRFMLETGREVGGSAYSGHAYPVGFMQGNGWGKAPTPMQPTPAAEVAEWKARCAVMGAIEGICFKLDRNSSRMKNHLDNVELVDRLNDALPVLQELLEKIQPRDSQ